MRVDRLWLVWRQATDTTRVPSRRAQERYLRRLGLWWRQPDHYEWISDYVADKGLRAFMRVSMAVIMAVLTTVAALMLVSPSGPRGTWGRGASRWTGRDGTARGQ